ncbi:hypothetical protein FSP39_002644 [Pinctada imbricata]|uniref:C1q domain-containing protein n=1 Tax=Pinctada imbricata TaxID=66713 RepID=A0AA88XJ18_PINIB|nr:hypothetical protein FSP39_002644 [Pinctada imbricata]
MFLPIILILLSCHSCKGLLHPVNSGNIGVDDLYQMIQQQNKTIQQLLERDTKTVGFFARLTQRTPHLGVGQPIKFDTVITNEGNGYDPKQSRFIAPFTGLYQLSASVMSPTNAYVHCAIVKNGADVSPLYGATTDYDSDTQTIVLDLQAGDMVWVKHTGTTNEIIHNYNSYFSGFLIKQRL